MATTAEEDSISNSSASSSHKIYHIKFHTGSSYIGEWDKNLGMNGKGIYKYPNDTTKYYGTFKNNDFHGNGHYLLKTGHKILANYVNGECKKFQLVFPDGLKFKTKNWNYCKFPNRQFYYEIKNQSQIENYIFCDDNLNLTGTDPLATDKNKNKKKREQQSSENLENSTDDVDKNLGEEIIKQHLYENEMMLKKLDNELSREKITEHKHVKKSISSISDSDSGDESNISSNDKFSLNNENENEIENFLKKLPKIL